MTNEELLADLKQFVSATVSQATADLATKNDVKVEVGALRTEVLERFDKLDKDIDEKLDEVLNRVGEDFVQLEKTIKSHDNALNEHDEVHHQDYERRLTTLEHKLA
jgi:hypothetical protein